MGIYLKILAFTALVIGLSAVAPNNNTACAGTIAPQTCDTQVWRTMNNRARIETEREIMQNQNLIFKPDSILAYTCFDSMAAHIGAQAGVLFTHTGYWNPQPIQWGTQANYVGLDVAIQRVVLQAMTTYYSSNFNHVLLGGRGSELGLATQHQVTATASSSSTYNCGTMAQVWSVAKCMNFLHTANFANYDGFYPFSNLRGHGGSANVEGYQTKNEVRQYPTPCSGQPIAGSTWNLEYRHSRNESAFGSVDFYYQFGTPLNEAYTQVRERIRPGTCGAAIATGVSVILSPGSTARPYMDGVCTNPGCTYRRGSGTTVGTCN